jgi:hypothetical protein
VVISFRKYLIQLISGIFFYRPTPTPAAVEKHCLFSLIRDIICSNPYHRMNMEEIKSNLHQWAQKPENQQSPYNTWEDLLQPAVSFLAGEYPGKYLFHSILLVRILAKNFFKNETRYVPKKVILLLTERQKFSFLHWQSK